jgi:hypothetical protein
MRNVNCRTWNMERKLKKWIMRHTLYGAKYTARKTGKCEK